MATQQSSQLISLQQDGLYLIDLNNTTASKLDLPFTLPSQKEPISILNCRGMLCITLKSNNELAIWKPASKDFKKIPMVIPASKGFKITSMFKPGQTINPLGFGFDQVSNDYKIVTIIDRKTYVYTFKTSSWRESVPNTCLDGKFKDRAGTVIDNCIYWIVDRSHIKKYSTILCFDFVKEEYHELDYPMYAKHKFGSWLGISRGELCIIDHYPRLDNDMCVWRQERDQNGHKGWKTDPWINMTQRNLKYFDVGFACMARNDELFIVVKGGKNENDKVMVYNQTLEKFVEVSLGGILFEFREGCLL